MTTSEITDKIRSSALLVSIRLGAYNPVKTDASESKKVCDSHKIASGSKVMKVQKNTLPTAGVIKEIEQLDARITKVKDSYCAPFARGIGLLPAIKFFDLHAAITRLFDERERLVAKLTDEYSIYLDEAKRELNGAFKAEDYPPVETVSKRFYAKIESFEIADPKDSKLGVLGEIAQSIQQSVRETLNDKLESVTPYLFESLLKPLRHLSSVLQNPDHKLAQSAFSNAVLAAEQAEPLNLLDNEQIRNAAYEIKSCLNKEKDMVKDDDHLRKQVLSDCNRIIESLDGEIPAPAVHKPSASKKSKKSKKAKVSETAPSAIMAPEDTLEESHEEPSDEQIHAAADAAEDSDETFDPTALLAKLGW